MIEEHHDKVPLVRIKKRRWRNTQFDNSDHLPVNNVSVRFTYASRTKRVHTREQNMAARNKRACNTK